MLALTILIFISFIFSKLGFKLIPPLLIEAESIEFNFKGDKIPVGYGLIFAFNLIVILILGTLFGYYSLQQVIPLITLILAMAFVGLLDDTFGNKDSQGFSGHFKSLIFERRLTTGAIKAIFSLMVVLFINFYWNKSYLDLFINTFLILLMSNFINLVDLRPGRALKVTLFFLISLLGIDLSNYLLIIPIVTMVVVALNFDLQAKGMMGDIGSNVLGVSLGGILAINYGIYIRTLIMLLLFSIHLYSEFHSLSEFIKNNKILLYLDKLGR